jgi:hypothetical protein
MKVVLFHLFMVYLVTRGQDSSAGMATSYRLDERRIGVRLLAGTADSYIIQSIQTEFGAHSISCLMGIEDSFPWGNSARACS